MLYPPSENNSDIPYGANGHRFVPSIRLEMMRDSWKITNTSTCSPAATTARHGQCRR